MRLVLDAGGDPSDPIAAEAAARSLRAGDLERDDLREPVADAAAAAWATAVGCISGVSMISLSRACFSGTRVCLSRLRKMLPAWA